ncbi:PREDICTED: E3 ubiquitin-protein ligase HECTD1-like [Acropora digitifera]|uniref:E3 ubiquitin-protein ligase HECTD1-like n=1 Tax=Acropora digitifera TaxID=70779 RepID=UPI00077ADAC1|nr:PREDICTED: E3 ubiquitin-protein ligase HECTD1-like [Acropora digitifera]
MRITKESNIQEELKEERSKTANLQREIDRLRATSREMPGRVFNYDKDFDKRGVVYDLATNGKTSEGNPSSTQIVATRSSNGKGCAEDVLENQVKWGKVSKTKDEENSWWCVDLTEKHALYLTHYTLRHGRNRTRSILVNWRLEGSLDGRRWITLKNHEDDHGLKKGGYYCTCTWAIDGNPSAFRYFRVLQTDKNSSDARGRK